MAASRKIDRVERPIVCGMPAVIKRRVVI